MGNIVAFSLLVAVLTIACGPRTQRERDAGRDAPNDTPATIATHHTTCPDWTGFAYDPLDTGLDESAAINSLTSMQVDIACQAVLERVRPLSAETLCSTLASPWIGPCQASYDRCIAEGDVRLACGPTVDYLWSADLCVGVTVDMFEEFIAHWVEYAARTPPGSYCSTGSDWLFRESNFCIARYDSDEDYEGYDTDYEVFRCVWGRSIVPGVVE